MPDPARLLRTIHLAIEAFRATPGRRGRLVHVQNVDEILVAGDLHGNLDNLRRLLERAELASHPRRHLVLQELVHGVLRYPQGGDKSHQLLDLLAALKCQFPLQVHMLLGNHELAQWTGQWIAKSANAGLDLSTHFRAGVSQAYGAAADGIYEAYTGLFAALPLALRTPNRVFLCHSIPSGKRMETFDPALLERDDLQPAELLQGGAIHALVWGRNVTAANAAAFLHKVDADLLITGHIPCPAGFEVPNDRQLILDSLGDRAAYCLFPTTHALAHEQLIACVRTLHAQAASPPASDGEAQR